MKGHLGLNRSYLGPVPVWSSSYDHNYKSHLGSRLECSICFGEFPLYISQQPTDSIKRQQMSSDQVSEDFIASVLRSLHRSTFIHFKRSTHHPVHSCSVRSLQENRLRSRNFKLNHVVRVQQEGETLKQVAKQLERLISRKKLIKRARKAAKARIAKNSGILAETSLEDESNYLGDASALSSLAFLAVSN